jgi:hypothetical protein
VRITCSGKWLSPNPLKKNQATRLSLTLIGRAGRHKGFLEGCCSGVVLRNIYIKHMCRCHTPGNRHFFSTPLCALSPEISVSMTSYCEWWRSDWKVNVQWRGMPRRRWSDARTSVSLAHEVFIMSNLGTPYKFMYLLCVWSNIWHRPHAFFWCIQWQHWCVNEP